MSHHQADEVRPTLRVIEDDLLLALPAVDMPLTQIDHPVVAHAQLIPHMDAAGGAARVVSLTDRVWLKVKTGRHRGGVTQVSSRDATDLIEPGYAYEWLEGWWLGYAGQRKEGAKGDVYTVIQWRSRTPKRGASRIDTSWLLPTTRDARRAIAEFAAREERSMRDQVLATIVASAVSGQPITTHYGHHALTVLVKAPDNLTFLAIGLTGVRNPREIAALLSCVPGVDASEWGIEPGGVLGLQPRTGQLIYSTPLEPSVLAELITAYPPGTLTIE